MNALLLLCVRSARLECSHSSSLAESCRCRVGTSNDQRGQQTKPQQLSFLAEPQHYLSDDATITHLVGDPIKRRKPLGMRSVKSESRRGPVGCRIDVLQQCCVAAWSLQRSKRAKPPKHACSQPRALNSLGTTSRGSQPLSTLQQNRGKTTRLSRARPVVSWGDCRPGPSFAHGPLQSTRCSQL